MQNSAPVAIAIHGGAGTIVVEKMSADIESAYRKMLEVSVSAGHNILTNGGTSTEAVAAAVEVMEDSELFNAGKGSVFTHAGDVEMDASIMEGQFLNAGAIAGVKHIKNPIMLAKEVMDHSSHVMLIGEGAEEFSIQRGFEQLENSYFQTERRRQQLLRIQKGDGSTALSEDATDGLDSDVDDKKLGTVGAVAIDDKGNIAAATSTGGMSNKKYGRVGDSPIIGAGTYADNKTCGISATGHGEYFIRTAVAYDICARVSYKGLSLQAAADEVVLDRLKGMGADGGIVGIDSVANVVFSFNSEGMYRASVDKHGELTVKIFRD
jgi:beta-aspartyl-peptidase (threonine type)